MSRKLKISVVAVLLALWGSAAADSMHEWGPWDSARLPSVSSGLGDFPVGLGPALYNDWAQNDQNSGPASGLVLPGDEFPQGDYMGYAARATATVGGGPPSAISGEVGRFSVDVSLEPWEGKDASGTVTTYMQLGGGGIIKGGAAVEAKVKGDPDDGRYDLSLAKPEKDNPLVMENGDSGEFRKIDVNHPSHPVLFESEKFGDLKKQGWETGFVAGVLTDPSVVRGFGFTANYSGKSMIYGQEMDLTVNFGSAGWSGNWSSGQDGAPAFSASGGISGATFSGSVEAGRSVTGGAVNGNFIGDAAQSLIGSSKVQATTGTFADVFSAKQNSK